MKRLAATEQVAYCSEHSAAEDGELTERRIKTDREHISELLAKRAPARAIIESSTESEWVACYIEVLGREVVIADPNFAPMYAARSRKVKTDKRDARTLVGCVAKIIFKRGSLLSALR